jgi:hypothetical protein
MYTYVKDIDKTDLVIYAMLIIAVALLVTRIAPNPMVITGIIIGVMVVYFLNDKKVTEQGDYVQKIISILKAPRLDTDKNVNLYKDALIVEFLELHKEYEVYNPHVYKSLTKLLDNFLKIADDIDQGSANYNRDYDILTDTKTKILNTYHSFIYKVPHTQASLHKFHDGTKKLLELLNDHIDKTHRTVLTRSEAEGVNVHTKFHYKAHPKPTDPDAHLHYQYHA